MHDVILNLQEVALGASRHGTRFESHGAELGPRLGLFGLGAALFEVPPGKISGPLHRHHTSDELFVILAGTGTYRYGEQRIPVRPGDCLAAPAAGEGHQIINSGTETLRYLAVSNNTNADVVENLESGRIRVDVGARGFHREDATFKQGGRFVPMGYGDKMDE